MHTSLDGFTAGSQGEMDWIHVDDDIFDFASRRINVSDTALYGRVTYEMMQAYWPKAADQPNATKHDLEHSQWYNNVEKVVLSRTMQGKSLPRTTIISNDITGKINELKNRPGKDILMFGSPGAAHSLMELDLIDEYWLFVNPILRGVGIPLFAGINRSRPLSLLSTHASSSGVVCLNYQKDPKEITTKER